MRRSRKKQQSDPVSGLWRYVVGRRIAKCSGDDRLPLRVGMVTITLFASAIAAVLGIMLLRRPSSRTALLSTFGGVNWVALYTLLIAIQSDDTPAWSANAIFAVVGSAAAFVALRAGQSRP